MRTIHAYGHELEVVGEGTRFHDIEITEDDDGEKWCYIRGMNVGRVEHCTGDYWLLAYDGRFQDFGTISAEGFDKLCKKIAKFWYL